MKKPSRILLAIALVTGSFWVSPVAHAGTISQTSGTGAHAGITAGQTFTMPSNENGALTSITVAGLYFRTGSVNYVGCIGAMLYTSPAKTTLIDTATNTICDTDGSGLFTGTPGSGTFNFTGGALAANTQYYFEYFITSGSSGGTSFYVNENTPSSYAGGTAYWTDGSYATYDLQFTLTYANLSNCTVASTSSGGYGYVAIKNAGTRCIWNVPSGVSAADFLTVAGGGGGGSRHSGGGGAGGLLKPTGVSLTNISSLAIFVGSGGAGGSAGGSGTNGETSTVAKLGGSGSFSSLVAIGGGAGGGASAATGGSAGGSFSNVTYGTSATGTPGIAGQGNAGGRGGYSASAWSSGGGGGAGAAAGDGSATAGGDGGAGTTWLAAFNSSIATSLALTDLTGVFAGGGGGGITLASGSASGGAGGTGGGGAGGGTAAGSGRAGATGVAGIANTGGGGGGSGLQQGAGNVDGGAGGSGVVIIRYVLPSLSVSLPTYSGTINKGTLESITVTVNMPGKVRFFFDSKRIPGCLAVSTTGSSPTYTATCTWKPAVSGSHSVYAIFTPTDSAFTAQTTPAVGLPVLRRSNTR